MIVAINCLRAWLIGWLKQVHKEHRKGYPVYNGPKITPASRSFLIRAAS